MTDGNPFTLLFDDVVAEVGLLPAAVFGVVWRYCQRRYQECYAAQQTLADHLGITRQTLNKHLTGLVEAGYLEDVTPAREGQPHTYRLTNKRTPGAVTVGAPVKEADTPKAEPVKDFDTTCKGNGQVPVKDFDTRSTTQERKRSKKPTAATHPRASRNNPPHQAFYSAIKTVCYLDDSLKSNQGRLNRTAKEIRDSGRYTPNDILRWYGRNGWWYRKHWMGQKGSRPEPEMIPKTLGEARAAEQPRAPATAAPVGWSSALTGERNNGNGKQTSG